MSLPPNKGIHEYKIPLKPDAIHVHIRPHRYNLKEKGTIKKLVNEMGIIHDSSRLFASNVASIGTKDDG